MNVLILIPARYASTRFPGKPLAEIGGKPMIQHVVEKAQLVSQDAFVATDDQRIYDRVVGFGGKVVMTSADHKSGTDRCCEAYRHIVADYRKTYDVVVNIQGDEPFIQPDQVRALIACFEDPRIQIALFFPFCHSLLPGKRARRMECCDSFLQTCGHVCLPA